MMNCENLGEYIEKIVLGMVIVVCLSSMVFFILPFISLLFDFCWGYWKPI